MEPWSLLPAARVLPLVRPKVTDSTALDHQAGKGTYTTPRSSYSGSFVRSKRHGFGAWVGPMGDRYEGEWAHDAFHGHGVHASAKGGMYSGQWQFGRRHGAGNYSAPSQVLSP